MTTSNSVSPPRSILRSGSIVSWTMAGVTVVGLAVFFHQGLTNLFAREWSRPEYSHGILIPLISAGIVWLKRREVAAVTNRGAWAGIAILIASLLLALVGQLATIYLLIYIALVFSIIGFVLSFLGWSATRVLWFPLLYLFFMVPLPDFLIVQLSAEMQLLSSALGVWFIRLFGISVFLEGNVIDLGGFKMQVVEACNGLRYLFPLMSFGMLIAYLYKGPLWQRAVLFLSTIPITIAMNVLRIGLIGLLYEYSGIFVAEGLLHDFEGWAVFLVCIAILLIEIKILTLFVPGRKRLIDLFSVLHSHPERKPGPYAT